MSSACWHEGEHERQQAKFYPSSAYNAQSGGQILHETDQPTHCRHALCASVYRLLAASRRRNGTSLHALSSHAHLKMRKAAFTCIEALCLTLVIHLE